MQQNLIQAFTRIQEIDRRISESQEPDYKTAYHDLFGTLVLIIGFLLSFGERHK